MNNKDAVLRLYPYAVCHTATTRNGVTFCFILACNDKSKADSDIFPQVIGSLAKTEDQAWESAMYRINKDMIRKMES